MISMSVYSNNETYGRVTMNFGNEQRDRLGKERYQYNLCRKMGLYCQSFSQLMERQTAVSAHAVYLCCRIQERRLSSWHGVCVICHPTNCLT